MKHRNWNRSLCGTYLALAIGFLLIPMAQAQTFNVIHTFTGGADGTKPLTGLTVDRAGNLYGTTYQGGSSGGCGGYGCGTAYQLKRSGSNWVVNPLYTFTGGTDGGNPLARVVFGPDGALYGTTSNGGPNYGTVFKLRPPPRACITALCGWEETTLHQFSILEEGASPVAEVVFDQAGSLYSTTSSGGLGIDPPFRDGNGVVFELTPSGGSWTYSVPYKFTSSGNPTAGMIFDNAGNLYGPVAFGFGSGCLGGCGMIYELTPSESGWTEKTLYTFFTLLRENLETHPRGGLIFDSSGNLYGTTTVGGTGGGGTVFELIPSNGSWTLNILYNFSGTGDQYCGPNGALVLDGAGNLYGTTKCDGANGFGSVFKLTPTPAPPWTYTSLHDFTGGSDGAMPLSNVVFDSSGNLYGTASTGGASNNGVVWEITFP